MRQHYSVVVIGGGHAGVEAAAAAARLGVSTAIITLRKEGIGQMSCNPAIGGLGKGHLVKEVDALGGLMGQAIDDTGIQFRTLNTSKGPAVRASRAQADRDLYKKRVQELVSEYPGISVLEAEVSCPVIKNNRVEGVQLKDGSTIGADALVVTTGTFLRGLMHCGADQKPGGRVGDGAAASLSDALKALGFSLIRLKTGTPPRIKLSSIDFSSLEEQPGDNPPRPFSMMTHSINRPQISCWMTATNERVHDLIRSNKDKSPMFNGQIQSGGPRYCPSIEDKVFRFAERTSHNIFLEPEGYKSDVVYPNGISTSLPVDVQEEFVHAIKGLEQAVILQPGYAVEYDAINPTQLEPTLAAKDIKGLYFAGQINGTSGYEEAAGQGLIAGANAALAIKGEAPFILSRADAYIGVMIDDLITAGVDEPYRMFTSRAEYRLILREDNAARRLCPLGIEAGLVKGRRRELYEERESQYRSASKELSEIRIRSDEATDSWLASLGSSPLKETVSPAVLVRRPELTLQNILDYVPLSVDVGPDLVAALEIELKFSGYLERQEEEIRKLKKVEQEVIPAGFPYDSVNNLRVEHREKLKQYRPHSISQALRIPGMTPTAVSLLAVHVKRFKGAGGITG